MKALFLERKKLYEEGKYIPTSYAYIWPRRAFLNWAEKGGPSI
jgi:hypothetical protein